MRAPTCTGGVDATPPAASPVQHNLSGGEARTPGYYVASAEALETAGLVRLTISSGVVDFAILLDLEEAIDLHAAIAHAARAVSEAAA